MSSSHTVVSFVRILTLILAAVVCGIPVSVAQKPNISFTSPVSSQKHRAAPTGHDDFKEAAVCSSCIPPVSGTLVIEREQVRFCCDRIEDGTRNLKVTAACPYSFTISLASIARQYDAVYSAQASSVWHVVTREGTDYAFTTANGSAAAAALIKIAASARSIPDFPSPQNYKHPVLTPNHYCSGIP